MNNIELIIVLCIGTVLMCIPISIQMKWYQIDAWKSIVISIVLVFTGVIGSRLWYFVENGTFRGRSFYGAIFLAPIVYIPVAKILKIMYREALDFCAPAGCLTLALVKIQCLRDGCCDGIALYVDENHNYVKFPSQITEMVAFLVIGGILMMISSKKQNQGSVFTWFLILYGIVRFILNFFRDGIEPYAMGLSAGSFWSLIAFCVGFVVIMMKKKLKI